MSSLYATFLTLFHRNEKLSFMSAGAFVLIALALMGVVSLASLNDKAMKGYQLSQLENERQELVSDGEVTEMLALKARSMDAIESQVGGMIKPDHISYVMPVTVVAQHQDSAFE